MTVNEKVRAALAPFGLPVLPTFSNDDKAEYFTFDCIDDRAEEFGDNEPLEIVAYLQIHYVAPITKDYLAIKKKIRKALLDADFTYPEVTDATTKGDNIRHLVFECSVVNEDELIEEL